MEKTIGDIPKTEGLYWYFKKPGTSPPLVVVYEFDVQHDTGMYWERAAATYRIGPGSMDGINYVDHINDSDVAEDGYFVGPIEPPKEVK